MVDHVGQQLQTAFGNILTLLFAGRLKKSVSLAGAKVLLGTNEHLRRFGPGGYPQVDHHQAEQPQFDYEAELALVAQFQDQFHELDQALTALQPLPGPPAQPTRTPMRLFNRFALLDLESGVQQEQEVIEVQVLTASRIIRVAWFYAATETQPAEGPGHPFVAAAAELPGEGLDTGLVHCGWHKEGRMRHVPSLTTWLHLCPVVAPCKPLQAPRSSQEATQPAASEPGPNTPPPANRTKAEPAAEPTEPTKGEGKGKGKAAKPSQHHSPAALNMQRIGESRWRPLELCYWPDQGALPAKGKEYPGLGYKRLRDKPPKAQQQQQQPAEAQYTLSTLLSLYNKQLLGRDGKGVYGKGAFPAPLLMSALQFVLQHLLARLVFLTGLVSRTSKPDMGWMAYLRNVVPNGITTGLDIGFSNMSLVFITMSFYTMCKSTVPVYLLLFAFLWRIEKPSWELAAVVAIICSGLVLLVEGESSFNAIGFALVMTASCLAGLRFTLTQVLLHGHQDAGKWCPQADSVAEEL
ncbi:hypothetical protein QJQ45_006073 [Haematococcus lacustris]|nr:hypothetical protein QJQ45_006073 [Haematococcus lacustris]